MNQISGRVIRNDNRRGIKDLIVVLYDIDSDQQSPSNIKDESQSQEVLAARYLQLIYGGKDTEEDPALHTGQPIADRLGSVITDAEGRFELSYDDSVFNVQDKEARPDLVLMVIAPDRSSFDYTPDTPSPNFTNSQLIIPLGTPEHERILHLSIFARRNAGRKEQAIIRISGATLDRFQIDQDQALSASNFVSRIAEADSQRKTLRKTLKDRLDLSKEVQKRRQRDNEATAFVAKLSAVPASLRAQRTFVRRGEDPSVAFQQAREDGVAQLALHNDIRNTAAHLRLSDDDLRRLGIGDIDNFKDRLRAGENIEHAVDPNTMCSMLQEKVGGTELVRITRLADSRRDEIVARLEALRNGPPEVPALPGDTEEEPGEIEPEEVLAPEEKIRRLVLAQVRVMEAEGDEEEEKGQVERLREAIETLKPPASPADATAFHDFNHLQIALPDVWAEAFNRDARAIVEQLHIEYRNHEAEYGGEATESVFGVDRINLEELEDLKEYTDLLGGLVGDITAVEERPLPSNVSAVIATALSSNRSNGWETVRGKVNINGAEIFAYVQVPTISPTRIVPDSEIKQIWDSLSIEQQQMLIELASERSESPGEPVDDSRRQSAVDTAWARAVELLGSADKTQIGFDMLKDMGLTSQPGGPSQTIGDKNERVLAIISNPEGRVTRVQRLMAELAQRLSEPHSFRIFQKNSVNFGIVTTYRQEWQPCDYQVGSLAGTLPLAPGETRKYSKKVSTKKTRSDKENEKYASTISDERTITSRAVADIMQKANTTTNFNQTVESQLSGKLFGFDVGLNTSTQFQRNQAVESERVKKAFHEAVRKASQEFKNERSVEVSTKDVSEFETSSTSEISNPNNEITVTYLFYELERQYRVSEYLHRLSPVVLVAQEVPNPSDIDEDWLLAQEWILRRSLLDASFHEALDYLSEGLVSDEVALEVRREHYETQKGLVDDLAITVDSLSTLQETLRNTLVQTSEQEQLARVAEKRAKKRRRRGRLRAAFGLGPPPGLSARIASGAASLGFGSRTTDPAVLEARREALETRLEFLEGNLEDSRSQLTRAESVLERATQELTEAIQESFTRRNLVNQLRIHVKDNILHYMQAIWSYEKPDQRYFRLYDLPVDIPVPVGAGGADPSFGFTERSGDTRTGSIDDLYRFSGLVLDAGIWVTFPPPGSSKIQPRRLHQVADLDKLIGYKGNYMIFPLKECTYITDFMMQDYVDDYFGIREPDPVASFTTEELLVHAETIWHDEAATDEMRETLNSLIRQRLTSPRLENELIVVPTGQLFIEALKGEHALLENFKEQHRALDVRKVQEEINAERLENLRKAMRLVTETPLLDDPEVEKKVVVEGTSSIDLEV